MQLKKIEEQVQVYKRHLQSSHALDCRHWWESQLHFQQYWDVLAEDFGVMYEQSLQNSETKRLWKRESYFPKQFMSKLIAMESDFVRQIFKDLFNEDRPVDGRVDRFQFYCDDLLQLYKENNPRSIENNHYHSNQTCFLYLAFRFPEKYAFYDFATFQNCLKVLGSFKIPQLDDVERFTKVCKTLWNFLKKDEEIFDLHQKRLTKGQHYMDDSMLMVREWMGVMR